MAETRRRGFHGLEDRIHELEEKDRKAPEREKERQRKAEEAGATAADIKPPPAHDE